MHCISRIRLIVFALLAGFGAPVAAQPTGNWQLPSRPSSVIGDLDGPPERIFGRIAGVVRLSDGSIIAADQQASQIRFFGPDGRTIAVKGRAGGGPGEFRTILSLHRCTGDTVVVYDPSALRFTWFGPRGDLLRTSSLQSIAEGGAPPYEVTCNNRGQFLLVNRSAAPPEGLGSRRPLVRLTLAAPGSTPIAIDTVRATERYFNGQNDFPRPLGFVTAVAASGSRVYVSAGAPAAIRAYDLTGRPVGAVPSARGTPTQISSAQLDRFIQDELDRNGTGDRNARERLLRSLPYHKELPPYRRLLVDALDRLWVETYPTPGAPFTRWTVVSSAGQLIGAVNVPADFHLYDVSADGLLGTGLSDEGVPQIWWFALNTRRPPGR